MRLWTTDDRVAALRRYDILDTAPEAAFEDIVEIARTLTGAPIALVSLLDAGRQWFKAARGADGLSETPLDTSFCMLAARDDADTLVIGDATADPRTAGMSLVVSEPRVRSYAGVLLRSHEGVPIGTVCVLDTEPRDFAPSVVTSLQALARQVTAQLELRRASAEGRDSAAALRDMNLGRELAMAAARLGRWDHRPDQDRRFFDARAREILGLGQGEEAEIAVADILDRTDPRDAPHVREALKAVMTPDRVGPFDVQFRLGPEPRWVSCVGRSLFENGVCTRFFGVVEDITERRRLEEQRDYLTEELNHRVKNILSLAQSVTDSTLRTTVGMDQARAMVTGRLQALARAHDVLLQHQWSAAELREVAVSTLEGAGLDLARIELDGPPVRLKARAALQMALALHELATNAAKYGALSNDTGRVALRWSTTPADGPDARPDARLDITWCERGGPPVTPPSRTGFGSRVIGRATEAAFDGVVRIDYAPGGLRWELTAPLPADGSAD